MESVKEKLQYIDDKQAISILTKRNQIWQR
jgi:hypothetical protein